MRHPVRYAVGVSAVLLLLAIPFLGFMPGVGHERMLPAHASSHTTADPIRAHVPTSDADALDTKASVGAALPWVLALIAVATFVLLFLMTGSVLVPVKAIVLSALALTATLGALVGIFQDGHLSGLLGFTPTGSIDVLTAVLVLGIGFGLSVGYQVILLERIKEEHELDRDEEHAIRVGLQKTGRSVTAAALLLTVVFAGLATSDGSTVQAFGVGLSLVVLVDAFVVRPTLVPAFLRLTRRSSWWAPAPLRRWHLRYGIPQREPIAILDRELEATR
jgi:RND superfamily putative drug exporter